MQRKILLITLLLLIFSSPFLFVKIAHKASSQGICIKDIDIVIAIDNTGSMGGVIATVKAQALNIMNSIDAAFPGFKIHYGVVAFKDYDDGAPTWPVDYRQPLTDNKTDVQTAINSMAAGGGGDLPEAYSRVMYESYTSFGYRPTAAKILLMMGDNVPHDKGASATPPSASTDGGYTPAPNFFDSIAGIYTDDILNNMAAQGVVLLYFDSSSGNKYLDDWQAMASVTGGLADATGPGIVNAIVNNIVRVLLDKDGDGWASMDCPCDADLVATYGLNGCLDCDDTRPDATPEEAHDCFAGGLVPCGRHIDDPNTNINETAPCSLCHIFVLIKRIIDFATGVIAFPILVLMIIVGGITWITAGGSESRISRGKEIIRTAVIAIIILLVAWVIIDTVIVFLTPAGAPWQNWSTINCPVP